MSKALAYGLAGAVGGLGGGLVDQWKAKREERQRAEQQQFQLQRDAMQNEARSTENERDREFRATESERGREFQAEQKSMDRAAADARSRRSGGGVGTLTTDAEGNMIRVKGSQIEYVTDAEGGRVKKAPSEDPTLAARELYRKTYASVAGDALAAEPAQIHAEVEKIVGFTLDDLNQSSQGGAGIGGASTPRGPSETTPNGRAGSGGAPDGGAGMVQVNSQADLDRLLKSGAIKPGDTIMTPGGARKVPANG
ncbi:MAG: hypothetical protein AAGD08_16010 [Pseudomonadota bacterium]